MRFGMRVGLRKTGFLVLLCAYALNLAAWGIQTGVQVSSSLKHKEPKETTAADAAISVPRTIAVCPHHPHGCPKDCMCPKTYITVGVAAENDSGRGENPGTLQEPAWVTCTQQGPQSLTPSFAVFLPEALGNSLVFTTTFFRMPDGKNSLADSFQEPPQKIPIA